MEGGPINALFTLFSQASGGFCSNLLIAFMFGGMFGSVMIGTGSDVVLGRTLINKFGTNFAIISLAIFVAICGFVGIQSWLFLAAVFAFSLNICKTEPPVRMGWRLLSQKCKSLPCHSEHSNEESDCFDFYYSHGRCRDWYF